MLKYNNLVLLYTAGLLLALGCSKQEQPKGYYVQNCCIENNETAAYLSETVYGSSYDVSTIASYAAGTGGQNLWQPKPVIIANCDKSRAPQKIWNLVPGDVYTYWTPDNTALTCTITGRVRMLYLPSLRNVRDLGGWPSEEFPGKRIVYGKMFRGGEMNTYRTLSAADSLEMRENLKIDCDLDLRTAEEASQITASPLGKDVCYRRKASTEYKAALKDSIACNNFLWILGNLKEGRNVYFHCAKGADRTGTLAFLMEGLLGVSESDLSKDFELTSFYDLRQRTSDNFKNFVGFLKTNFRGSSVCECCQQYFLAFGASPEDIRDFRAIMLK